MIPLVKPMLGPEEKEAVQSVLDSGMLVQGPKVAELEEAFKRASGTVHAIAVNSGTAALHAALYAAGIGTGDEVVTVPFTFAATANAVLMSGATLAFADIEPGSFCIDPSEFERRITKRTKAVLPVDLYGHPFAKAINRIAEDHGITVIEDACQSIGATRDGTAAGKLGDIGAFSLYATKNIIAGEGGVIVTDDASYAERARIFRHHGQGETTRYLYQDLGYNYRMTDVLAAIAVAQMKRLGELTGARQRNAATLSRLLKGIPGLTLPTVARGMTSAFHQYTVRVPAAKRDRLREGLTKAGIGSAIYYPIPLHQHPHFARLGYRPGDFPESERAAAEVISLPVGPHLSEDEVQQVAQALRTVMGGIA
ncbi:DegT/DnrJ/EryC1/StrS family aminotransferase [Candidatus Woesearchaeota archaeon]|nr:DegT/DnrJ/EryC1/StrS family aminotransferase [Candidatus Woesearchaeota archaeon]